MDTSKKIHKIVRVMIIGTLKVGKTSLVKRYVNKSFSYDTVTTVGVHINNQQLLIENERISLQIIDTFGQERYRSIPKSAYRTMNGLIIAFALDNSESFDIAKEWYIDIKNDSQAETVFILAGCKCDMIEERQVSSIDIHTFATQNNISYIETSAKDNINVTQLFEGLAKSIISNRAVYESLPVNMLPCAIIIQGQNSNGNDTGNSNGNDTSNSNGKEKASKSTCC